MRHIRFQQRISGLMVYGENVSKQCDAWLKENPNVEIINSDYHVDHNGVPGIPARDITLLVWYKENDI